MAGFLGNILSGMKREYLGNLGGRVNADFNRRIGKNLGPNYFGSTRNYDNYSSNNDSGVSRNQDDMMAFSSILNAEFDRLVKNTLPSVGNDALISAPMTRIPDIIREENIPYTFKTIDRNIRLVDDKVRQVDRNMNRQAAVMLHTKSMIEKTNRMIENNIRNTSIGRFKDIENKMEASHVSSLVDRRVSQEVERQIALMQQQIAAQGGGGLDLLSLIGVGAGGAGLGIGAGVAAGRSGLGRLLSGAGRGIGTAARVGSRFLGPIGVGLLASDAAFGQGLGTEDEFNGDNASFMGDLKRQEEQFLASILEKVRKNQRLNATEQQVYDMHVQGTSWGVTQSSGNMSNPTPISTNRDKDYENLMTRLDISKSTSATFIGEYDLFNLTSKNYSLTTSEMIRMLSKNGIEMTSDGEINIMSKQSIVFTAPNIKFVGVVNKEDYNLGSSGRGYSSNGYSSGGGYGGSSYVGSGSSGSNSGGYVQPGNGLSTVFNPGANGSPTGIRNSPTRQRATNAAGGTPVVGDSDRRAAAFRYFTSQGWTDVQAAAIVGNLMQESGADIDFTNNTGDDGNAFGSAQWNIQGSPDRYENFRRLYGKDLRESTYQEQLEFINWELTSDDPNNGMQKRAGDALRNTNNIQEATLIVSNQYERPNPRYAHNDQRISNANQILGNAESYTTVVPNEAVNGTTADLNNVTFNLDGKARGDMIEPDLQRELSEAVYRVYGPGYTAEVYSGGQMGEAEAIAAGAVKRSDGYWYLNGERVRTGSTRHDHGGAADVYITDPDGNRISGDGLAKLGQYWTASGIGGVGLEMGGGGIHLDTHEDRPPTWSYGNPGTPAARRAVAAGIDGVMPDGLFDLPLPEPIVPPAPATLVANNTVSTSQPLQGYGVTGNTSGVGIMPTFNAVESLSEGTYQNSIGVRGGYGTPPTQRPSSNTLNSNTTSNNTPEPQPANTNWDDFYSGIIPAAPTPEPQPANTNWDDFYSGIIPSGPSGDEIVESAPPNRAPPPPEERIMVVPLLPGEEKAIPHRNTHDGINMSAFDLADTANQLA